MSESEIKIERWKQFWQVANSDPVWTAAKKVEDEKREIAKQELRGLFNQFLTDEISVQEFRSEFDKKTRTVWDVFGLKGMSGAMFLNKLVKHIADSKTLTRKLKQTLPVPASLDEATTRLSDFLIYLDELIATGESTKSDLQPARASFFISAWWHLQDTETWPVYYVSGRKALALEGAFNPTGETVNDYIAFREVFNHLAENLQLTSWQCEHLLDWFVKDTTPLDPPKTIVDTEDDEESDGEESDEDGSDDATKITHTQIQWLLAKLGHKFGCQVWIASNDHSKTWQGESLGELSVKSLPSLGLDSSSQKIIGLIDVVWLKGTKQIAAAFEIEHTTSVFSGILRMSDLVALSPNLNFPLYLVAPSNRMEKVKRELSRPTFQALELHKRCGYFSDEALIKEASQIMRWATDVSAIERLASKVDDIS